MDSGPLRQARGSITVVEDSKTAHATKIKRPQSTASLEISSVRQLFKAYNVKQYLSSREIKTPSEGVSSHESAGETKRVLLRELQKTKHVASRLSMAYNRGF